MDVAAFRSIDVSDLSYASSSLRKACNLIPEYINENGGWTLIGLHCRGANTNHTDGTVEVNSYTQGHIVCLEPT